MKETQSKAVSDAPLQINLPPLVEAAARKLQIVDILKQTDAGLHGEVIYVSPKGNDSWSGKLKEANGAGTDGPIRTLERARDLIRARKGAGPAAPGGYTVCLQQGSYAIGQTFALHAEDSGTPDAPVTYRACPNEQAVLEAGIPVPASRFEPVTDPALLARLDPGVRGKVMELDLGELGIWHDGPYPDLFTDNGGLLELYYNQQRMPLSQWPDNGGYTTMKAVVFGSGAAGDKRGGIFEYREDRPQRWQMALQDGGVWLSGFWRVPWTMQSVKVAKIDPDKQQITFAVPVPGGIGSKYSTEVNGTRQGDGTEKWYVRNLLEEITLPGEWSVDFKRKKLYFYPPGPLEDGKVMIADRDTPLLTLTNASNIRIVGLTFEGGLGNGAVITGGQSNQIVGAVFRNLGGTGVIIDGGKRNGVSSSDLYDLGAGGIYLSGGDLQTLEECGNYAINNHIHDFGKLVKTYAPGIGAGFNGQGFSKTNVSVGSIVAYNRIHGAPHAAVLYGGNENLFAYNEVYDIALDSGDVGAFYTAVDWTSRGNVLMFNYVHHVEGANAFYMDDGDSGDTVFGNIVYRANYGSLIGGGHDNDLENNVFVDSLKYGVLIDDRGVSRGYNAANKQRVDQLNALHVQNPPWSTRYPQLATILENHPDWPTGNRVVNNVFIQKSEVEAIRLSGDASHFASVTKGPNLIQAADPGFMNRKDQDFRLKKDAEVFAKLPGFVPIPLEEIGLYKDAFRTDLPQPREAGTASRSSGFDSQVDVEATNKSAQ